LKKRPSFEHAQEWITKLQLTQITEVIETNELIDYIQSLIPQDAKTLSLKEILKLKILTSSVLERIAELNSKE